MKTIKIIFLMIFAFVLTTGLECFGQDQNETKTEEDNLTLRDDDLPYDSLADLADYSSNDESYDLSDAGNVEPNNENVELELSNPTYIGRVYYFNVLDHLVYRIDVVVNRPNFIRYYYSINGYDYIYYPYASPIVYDTWWSWSLFRYSSWGSFCHRYPSFNRRVNHYCHSLNFGNGNYGRPINLRDHYYGKRGNYGGSSNNQGRQRSDNNGYGSAGEYKNTQQASQSTNASVNNFQRAKRTTGNTVVWKNGNRQNGSNGNFTENRSKQSTTSQTYTPATRSYTNPNTANNERRYSPKNNSTVNSRQDIRPSNNQDRNYTPPTRTNSSPSYSTPSRTNSSPGYSTPLKSSSPGYSAPSRSSNKSGGSSRPSSNGGGYHYQKK